MRPCKTLLLLTVVALVSSVVIADEFDESKAIEKIELLGGKVKSADNLPGRPVVEIDFQNPARFNDKYVHLLKSFPNLSKLNFSGLTITDAVVKEIGVLENLQELSLMHTSVTDAGLQELRNTHLSTFRLSSRTITDEGLKGIKGLRFLRTLSLDSPMVTDAGMKEISNLKYLTVLSLQRFQMTDAGLMELAKLENLSKLDLFNMQITDDGLKELSKSKSLTALNIHNAKITDDGLKELSNLKDMADLNIQEAQISDAGLKELSKLTNLMTLHIRQPKITDEFTEAGLRELKRTLPDLKIVQQDAATARVIIIQAGEIVNRRF